MNFKIGSIVSILAILCYLAPYGQEYIQLNNLKNITHQEKENYTVSFCFQADKYRISYNELVEVFHNEIAPIYEKIDENIEHDNYIEAREQINTVLNRLHQLSLIDGIPLDTMTDVQFDYLVGVLDTCFEDDDQDSTNEGTRWLKDLNNVIENLKKQLDVINSLENLENGLVSIFDEVSQDLEQGFNSIQQSYEKTINDIEENFSINSNEISGNQPSSSVQTAPIDIKQENQYAKCHFLVDYPIDAKFSLKKAIMNLISNIQFLDTENSPQRIVQAIATDCLNDLTDIAQYDERISSQHKYYRNVTIKKIADTSKFVTYQYLSSEWSGGNQEFITGKFNTLDNQNGKLINHSNDVVLKNANSSAFQNILKKHIIKFLLDREKEQYTGNLENYIDMKTIPLPSTPVFFTNDGIGFYYGSLELFSAMVYGRALFVIPYTDILPFLTHEALNLSSNL